MRKISFDSLIDKFMTHNWIINEDNDLAVFIAMFSRCMRLISSADITPGPGGGLVSRGVI